MTEQLDRLTERYYRSRQAFLDHLAVKRHLFEATKSNWHRIRPAYLLDEITQLELQSELLVMQECQDRIQHLLDRSRMAASGESRRAALAKYASFQHRDKTWRKVADRVMEARPEIWCFPNWSWSIPVSDRTTVTQKEHVCLPSYPDVPLFCVRMTDGYLAFLAISDLADAKYCFGMATIGVTGATCHPDRKETAADLARLITRSKNWSKDLSSLLSDGIARWPELERDHHQQHRGWIRESGFWYARTPSYRSDQLQKHEDKLARKLLASSETDQVEPFEPVGYVNQEWFSGMMAQQRVLKQAIDRRKEGKLVIQLSSHTN